MYNPPPTTAYTQQLEILLTALHIDSAVNSPG